MDAQQTEQLLAIRESLPPGFKVHCDELLNGKDPTGGLITIDSQVELLKAQAERTPDENRTS